MKVFLLYEVNVKNNVNVLCTKWLLPVRAESRTIETILKRFSTPLEVTVI